MKRSKHSLSHYRLSTLNQGVIYPIACLEVLPGDSFRHSSSLLVRVSPLLAPVMHPVHLQVHHWFVPNRILWDNWEKFIVDLNTTLSVPTIVANAGPSVQLAQAFGIGIADTGSSVALNALPFRAYNKIYNEFYRDQDLTTPLTENTSDTDTQANYAIRKASWQKDYFTICRPQPQKGNAVSVGLLGGSVPVKTSGSPQVTGARDAMVLTKTDGTGSPPANTVGVSSGGHVFASTTSAPAVSSTLYPNNLFADLTGAPMSMDINAWRTSMAFQKMQEHRNRYGSRYTDYLRFLGVTPADARLQRPEYLGGGRQTISFSEVLSTAATTDAGLGDLAGHGIAAMRTRPYKRFFEEHGWILSFVIVRPVTVYMNQVPRKFLRLKPDQFWQKELEMMGEQSVPNVEVYGPSLTPNNVFGYMPRHDDYRRHESFVSGQFRGNMMHWHMARNFATQPVLNGSFVEADPTNRIYAETVSDQLQCMIAHRISARRLVSKIARTLGG